MDNLVSDYLGSDYTCLMKEEKEILIDIFDFEEINGGEVFEFEKGEYVKVSNLEKCIIKYGIEKYLRKYLAERFSTYD